jgi:uncharacterized membrane protein YhhN
VTTTALVFTVAMTVAVAVVLYASKTRRKWVERVAKPVAAMLFIAAALVSGALESAYGTVLFAGLTMAAVGDVLLLGEGRRMFLGGLVAFLSGHLAYAIAFAIRGVDATWTACASGALAIALVPILRWLWPHVDRRMKGPVIAYVAVISIMVALAFGTHGFRPDLRILLGSIAFYASDFAVARQRFVEKGFVNRAVGLPLYFFGQLALALSVD